MSTSPQRMGRRLKPFRLSEVVPPLPVQCRSGTLLVEGTKDRWVLALGWGWFSIWAHIRRGKIGKRSSLLVGAGVRTDPEREAGLPFLRYAKMREAGPSLPLHSEREHSRRECEGERISTFDRAASKRRETRDGSIDRGAGNRNTSTLRIRRFKVGGSSYRIPSGGLDSP